MEKNPGLNSEGEGGGGEGLKRDREHGLSSVFPLLAKRKRERKNEGENITCSEKRPASNFLENHSSARSSCSSRERFDRSRAIS